MKLSQIITLTPLFLCPTDRESSIDTALAFGQTLDEKSEAFMRSVTTKNIIFDGTLFAGIGLGGREPLVGQDVIAQSVLGVLTMPTSHHLSNFGVQLDRADHANLTAYVLLTITKS